MKHVIVKDPQGDLVCFGPDDGMYEPVLAAGQTRHVVDELPEPSKKQKDAEKAEKQARRAVKDSALAKLKAVGLSDGELKALGLRVDES